MGVRYSVSSYGLLDLFFHGIADVHVTLKDVAMVPRTSFNLYSLQAMQAVSPVGVCTSREALVSPRHIQGRIYMLLEYPFLERVV